MSLRSILPRATKNFTTSQSLTRPILASRNNFHTSRTNMGVTTITSYEAFQQAINGDKPVIVDFTATWCGPCKMIGPIFEKISETPASEKLNFFKCDVDEQEKVAQEVGIRAMPTFMVFKNGEKIETVVGADPGKLQAAITKHSS